MILKAFGKAVNAGGVGRALKQLGLTEKKLETAVKSRQNIIKTKEYDMVLDCKPKIKFLILYLSQKKHSKKLVKSLKPSKLDFKSLVVLLGKVKIAGSLFELRLGAFGYTSAELGKAIMEYMRGKR
jgi:hypothetical protein